MQLLSTIRNAIGKTPSLIVFSLFFFLIGLVLWVTQLSFVSPGPAIGAIVLGAIFLIQWLATDPVTTPPPSEPPGPPIIIGLDILVQRWTRFNGELSNADKKNLFQQVSSIQKVFAGETQEITIVEAFPGNKPEKGALLVKPNNGALRVVKFDRVENMKLEAKRFLTCIEPMLNQQPGKPVAYWPPETDWKSSADQLPGVVVYKLASFNAGPPKTFAQFYQQKDADAVFKALNKIVEVMDSVWGEPIPINQPTGNCMRPNQTLYEEYRRLSDENKLKRMHKSGVKEIEGLNIFQFESNRRMFRLQLGNNKSVVLSNPLIWVREVFGRKSVFQEKFGKFDDNNHRRDSIVHGDFHGNNIIIEGGRENPIVWLIDFPHTHIGPTVQDIARLEVEIKFSLFPEKYIELDFAAIYAVENSILGDGSRDTLLLGDKPEIYIGSLTSDMGVELTKMMHCLSIIRHPHQHMYLTSNAIPYYLALLHATLPMLYYVDRTPWQKLYAFVSAAMLCELLDSQTGG